MRRNPRKRKKAAGNVVTGRDRTVSRLFSEDHRGFGPHGEHMAPKGTEIPSGLRPSLKSPFQELAVQYLNLMFSTRRLPSADCDVQRGPYGAARGSDRRGADGGGRL